MLGRHRSALTGSGIQSWAQLRDTARSVETGRRGRKYQYPACGGRPKRRNPFPSVTLHRRAEGAFKALQSQSEDQSRRSAARAIEKDLANTAEGRTRVDECPEGGEASYRWRMRRLSQPQPDSSTSRAMIHRSFPEQEYV